MSEACNNDAHEECPRITEDEETCTCWLDIAMLRDRESAEDVDWFGGLDEPEIEIEEGMRMYADGTIRYPTIEELASQRKKLRRYFAFRGIMARQQQANVWRDKDGWTMTVRRWQGLEHTARDDSGAVYYVMGPVEYQAQITHPDRFRLARAQRYIKTAPRRYRALAVADGLDLMREHRDRRRVRGQREFADRMKWEREAEERSAARLLCEMFAVAFSEAPIPRGFR